VVQLGKGEALALNDRATGLVRNPSREKETDCVVGETRASGPGRYVIEWNTAHLQTTREV
jgi:hypothetical protein